MTESRTAARTSKLADKFGITKRADYNALQNFVENPNDDPEIFLKAPANKINKLQAKLGEQELAQYTVSSGNSDRGECMNIHKTLKKVSQIIKYQSVSDELISDSEPVSPQSPDLDENDYKLLGRSNNTSGSDVDNQTESLRRSFASLKTSKAGSQSSVESLRNNARVGKLVDFFGAKEDNVGALRRMVQNTKETLVKRNSVPTFMLRVHFVNATHIIAAMPIEATSQRIVEHTLRKLMIHDDSSLYGIFLLNSSDQTGVGSKNPNEPIIRSCALTVIRMLNDTERVFDVVRTLKDGDYLLFRRKGKSDFSDEVPHHEIDEATGEKVSQDPVVYGKRRVTKLATFFGVKPEDRRSVMEGQAELEDLLHMVAESVTELPEQHSNETLAGAPSLKRQVMNESTIIKEGWLTIDATRGQFQEILAWVSLERGNLHVKCCNSQQSTKTSNHPVYTTPLTELQCEVPRPADPIFLVKSRKTNKTVYEFTASCTSDRDDWVSLMQKQGLVTSPEATLKTSTLQRSSRAGIDDFEFHRVLGKGKYGKVLLCSSKASKKVFAIKVIHNDDESQHTAKMESDILRSIKHPFIVGLHFAFQNPERLYLVMEYVNGGELFFHLSQSGRFPEKRAKFYGAEIILALQCLHGKGIVYRDLKLENVLLDKDGHIKIADFGLSSFTSKDSENKTFSMAGTVEYFAPEVIERVNYSYPADWWAFGVILFELICGYHPFYNSDPDILNDLILHAPLEFPAYISSKGADLISRLLDRNYKSRLGSGKSGMREIQQHPFFKEIDFAKLFRKELSPPWLPDLSDDYDVKFFDKEFTSEAIVDDDVKGLI